MSKQNQFPELRSIFDKNRDVMKMLKAERGLTDAEICFRAVYLKDGKKIADTKDNPNMSSFTTVINGRYTVCLPDSISITWHNAHTEEKLYEHTFPIISKAKTEIVEIPQHGMQRVQYGLSGTGQGFLGEADVNHLVEKRMSEMQQVNEYNRLKEENGKQLNRISELEKEKEALEKSIKAKSNIEYFITIIGSAFPDLGKVMAGADIFKKLADKKEAKLPLQGTNTAQQPNEQALIELLEEFMRTELNERELSSMYLLFLEFQKDKNLIHKLLEQVTKIPTQSHA